MSHVHGTNRRALRLDARSIFVEVPQHRGVTLPVTDIKVDVSDPHATATRGAALRRIYLEAYCRYCETSHYVELADGSVVGKQPLHE